MKNLFIIIMIVSLMVSGSALAATEQYPSLSNACTFDRTALLNTDHEDLIIHISYAFDEAYMEVVFGMPVDFSEDLAVTITDPSGKDHAATILNRDWSTLRVWVDGLQDLKEHRITISTIAAKDTEAYPQYAQPDTYTATFITIPSCCV